VKAQENDDNPPLVLNSFEELVFLAEDKRDLKVKAFLRRHIRLIEFGSGHFEFNLVGNPPRDVLQAVKKAVENWTRMRWNFVVSDKEGLPTLEEIEAAEKDNQMERARSHPAVIALLKAFDGARIVDVRIRDRQIEALPPAPEEAEEDLTSGSDAGNGLDDFYD